MSATISETPTDAEIMGTLHKLEMDNASPDSVNADAINCIRWLQAGLAAANSDLDTKRSMIETLTEGRGISDDDLWAVLRNERDKLRKENAQLKDALDDAERERQEGPIL